MNNLLKKRIMCVLILTLVFLAVLSFPVGAGEKAAAKKININTASSIELQKLPQIGEKVAQRIIDFREKNGKFKRIEELMKVKGIGEKTFEKLRDQITVGPVSKSNKR